MDAEFNSHKSKIAKEHEKRRLQAKKRLAAKKKLEEEVATATAARLAAFPPRPPTKPVATVAPVSASSTLPATPIAWQATYKAYPTNISGDRMTLPVSALEKLTSSQSKPHVGPWLFSVTCPKTGATTHASVLEFVAPEGSVGLPPTVAFSLGSDFITSPSTSPMVIIKQVELPTGSMAKVQPLGSGFDNVEIDLKLELERALKLKVTLTVDDVIFVRRGGQTVAVVIKELSPQRSVLILNTDLEVDVMVSQEVEEAEKKKKEEEEKLRAIEDQKQKKEAVRLEKLQALPTEPDSSAVKCIIRPPAILSETASPSVIERRVLSSDKLQILFDVVEAHWDLEAFNFTCTYPRRVYTATDDRNKTLEELGINGRQERFFVEIFSSNSVSENLGHQSVEQTNAVSPATESVWEKAKGEMLVNMDKELLDHKTVPIHAMEPILPKSPPTASSSLDVDKWEAQLVELGNMGFLNRELNKSLLERYQGRLIRVVNYLSEM